MCLQSGASSGRAAHGQLPPTTSDRRQARESALQGPSAIVTGGAVFIESLLYRAEGEAAAARRATSLASWPTLLPEWLVPQEVARRHQSAGRSALSTGALARHMRTYEITELRFHLARAGLRIHRAVENGAMVAHHLVAALLAMIDKLLPIVIEGRAICVAFHDSRRSRLRRCCPECAPAASIPPAT